MAAYLIGEIDMITCKEDLIDTYIKNDGGELRDLYISKLKEFGVRACGGEGFDYLYRKAFVGVRDWGGAVNQSGITLHLKKRRN